MRALIPLVAASILAVSAACTINPVTGERELALVSTEDEISIGENQYAPSRQMQGGDYVLDPTLTAYVADVGRKLAAVSDRDLPYEFAVLNTTVPNAWALPGGKIAVNRGLLLELGSEAELAAVLGHEITHAAARHGAQSIQRGLILQGAVLATAIATRRENYSGLVIGAAGVGAQLINQRNSRGNELEADLYGMRYMSRAGYDPQAAVSLQQAFVRLAEGRPDQSWLDGLFASHPPSEERVERNRETAASLPAGGDVGRERFQQATAALRRQRPAYDAYDRGRTALAEDRLDDAERLAAEAVRLLPGEAHFHALLGDIDAERVRFDPAARHYGDAIARNDQFFYYYLQRGLARQQLGELDAAESDLETSTMLLPTAAAYYGLGGIAERRGNRATALEHYSRAAQSSSTAGRAAQDAVVRLDLPGNPGNYLMLRTARDNAGRLIVELKNPTRVVVSDVVVVVRYSNTSGVSQRADKQFSGRLQPGATARLATGLGPFATADDYQVVIESAQVVPD